jgi:hypothetical protein
MALAIAVLALVVAIGAALLTAYGYRRASRSSVPRWPIPLGEPRSNVTRRPR